MVLTRSQVLTIMVPFNNKSIQENKPVQIMASPQVNYLLIPSEGNINPREPQVIKIYLQAAREIEKETESLDISLSNAKDIINHFLSPANKYG